MSTHLTINRRINPDGTKGHTDMTSGTEHEEGEEGGRLGRRKFLILGGAGAAVLAGTAGAARALIRAGDPNATPRSLNPVGLDPATGREPTAEVLNLATDPTPITKVRHFALAGTDGWVSFPAADKVGGARGARTIAPYFPDPLADLDNKTTYAFCFRNVTGLDQSQVAAQKGHTQICAPLFYSTVGEEIWVQLTNLGLRLRPDLIDGHTLHWHGFRNAIPFYDGVPESSISVAIDHEFTYVYRPQDAGTYMYHCHFEDVEHVTMGMHGIVFVKPNPKDKLGLVSDPDAATRGTHAQKAYAVSDGDLTGETGYDREYAIMLSEIDTRAHFGDAHIQATDWTDFHADFWTMNGRSYPDTLEPNGVRDNTGQFRVQTDGGIGADGKAILNTVPDFEAPQSRLFSNPLSSLVQAAPGERILIRFANLGFLDHTIVFPGLQVDVLGRDARYVPHSAQRRSTDSIQIGPGESRDVFFTAPAAAGTYAFYDRGLSHYSGSADGSDSWVGGQRSEVRVIVGLAKQEKPGGWAGELAWPGEFPEEAKHTPPTVTAAGVVVTNTPPVPPASRGKFLDGTVTVDSVHNPGTYLANLWWALSDTAPSLPTAGNSNSWNSATFSGATNAFHIRVGGVAATAANYWVLAQDSGGMFSVLAAPLPVHF
jgi:FtsP/CotA-like multicopper oxidase with cupredoxin domain